MPKKSFSFQKPATDAPTRLARHDLTEFITGATPLMTRKTIALPHDAFLRVKIAAAKRGIPAARLWGEIVDAYFQTHAE